jgi:hypothetical protein
LLKGDFFFFFEERECFTCEARIVWPPEMKSMTAMTLFPSWSMPKRRPAYSFTDADSSPARTRRHFLRARSYTAP